MQETLSLGKHDLHDVVAVNQLPGKLLDPFTVDYVTNRCYYVVSIHFLGHLTTSLSGRCVAELLKESSCPIQHILRLFPDFHLNKSFQEP